jgi:hypothetical protein
MSMKINITVSCSNCNREYPTKIFRTIWGENPSNREIVFNDTINTVKCPDCRLTVKIPGSLLYVDADQQFAVWYEPTKDPQIDKDTKDYNKTFNYGNFYATAPRMADWEEFKLTINKFEKGELKAKPITNMKGLGRTHKTKTGCFTILLPIIVTLIFIISVLF